MNCTFGDGSCGYIDMSGNPYSKWLRDMSNSAVTGMNNVITHFIDILSFQNIKDIVLEQCCGVFSINSA